MRRPLRLVPLAAFLLASAAAGAADEPRFVDNDEKFGVVADVFEPRWPSGLRSTSAHVDIMAKLTGAGRLQDAELVPDRPEHAAFAEALRAVLPKWKFRTPPGRDCAPTTQPVHLRVMFEGDTGRIRVTHLAEARAPEEPNAVHREPPRFPRAMLRDGIHARVFGRAEVAPDGTVTGVRVRAFSRDVDPQKDALLPFEVEVTRAVRKWKYPPAPEGANRMRTACVTIDFNIVD